MKMFADSDTLAITNGCNVANDDTDIYIYTGIIIKLLFIDNKSIYPGDT